MKKIKYIVFVIFASCNSFNNDRGELKVKELKENHVLTEEGIYFSKEKNIGIEIEVEKSIVKYLIRDSVNKILFNSGSPEISNVHRWGILQDSVGVFWVQSSDIGLYTLRKDSQNTFRFEPFPILNDSNVKLIPLGIYNVLPNVIKRKFKRY